MQSSNGEKPVYEDGDGGKHIQYDTGDTEYNGVDSAAGEIQYETTKRGLKARHAQMIALGGTIGTG